MRSIAEALACAPSTISREIVRNGGPQRYRAAGADKQAWETGAAPPPERSKTACP
jgi:IS30 family transposase